MTSNRFPYGRALRALCVSAVLLAASRGARAATFLVNSFADDVDATPGNGVCQTSNVGERTLRAAIMEANALAGPDVIHLPAATYFLALPTPDEDANAGGDLDITDDLTLLGAAAGTTIVDGALQDRVFHVLTGTVAISDVTIRNGKSTDGAKGFTNANGMDGTPGGGIYNGGSLTLTRVVVSGNRTGDGGKAGNIECYSCGVVGGNGGRGGGISGPGTLTLANSRVESNVTGAGGPRTDGFDIHCYSTQNLCTTQPGERGNGGGIAGGVVTVVGSRLEANAAKEGAAIQQGGTLVVTGSSLVGNVAERSGGAIACNSGDESCTISSSTFSGNEVVVDGYGGAIFFGDCGTATVKAVSSSTISGNTADGGGGIAAFDCPVSLSFVTITKNAAFSPGGGGVFTSSSVTVVGTLIADNTGFAPDCYGTLTSLGHNLIGSTGGCTFSPVAGDVIGSDPKLAPLANNGGPTSTHALQAGSAALDAGGDATCGTSLTADQRGVKRPIGVTCDIGAFEAEPIGDANGDGSVSVLDVFYLINFLFAQGPVPRGRANVNGDGSTNVLDVFYLINFLFASGPAPM
jgi:CSLREA domain-containing protein